MSKKSDPLPIPGWLIGVGALAIAAVAALRERKPNEKASKARRTPVDENEPPEIRLNALPPLPSMSVSVEWRDYVPPKMAVKAFLPDMPNKNPATEAQAAAVTRLGLDVENLTYGQANAVLSARDYAETLIDRTARIEPATSRMLLIQWLVEDAKRIEYVMDWSWRTRNHDVRRIPRDAFRAEAERFLAST